VEEMVSIVLKDTVLMDKWDFIKFFKRYLEPEQIDELLSGYYDGDIMTIHSLGIEVRVESLSVSIPREIYEKVKAREKLESW